MELGTNLKTVVKAVGMVTENIGIDMEADQDGVDFSLAEFQQFLNKVIDLFIRYAYCGADTSCDRLNLAIQLI